MYIVMSENKVEISFFVRDEGSKVRIFIFSDIVEHFCKAKPIFCTHSVQQRGLDSFAFIDTS